MPKSYYERWDNNHLEFNQYSYGKFLYNQMPVGIVKVKLCATESLDGSVHVCYDKNSDKN